MIRKLLTLLTLLTCKFICSNCVLNIRGFCAGTVMTAASIDEYKHYVTHQYRSEHNGLYPTAGKSSGWQ